MTAKLGNESFTAKAPGRRHREVAAAPGGGRGGHRPPGVPAGVTARGTGPTACGSRLNHVDDIAEQLREVELEIGSRRAEHQIDPTLDRIAALVSLLGDPHRAFPVVHVTGTNGKTSTTRMIESLLRERGLRTGRFTSPHLVSMRERISVDGAPLSAERFVELYEEIAPYVQLVDDQQPVQMSFFEILTGMMFAAFADAPVDVAVIEVGMGGRWDATNVADGTVAVITPVAMDHMQWLGDTIEEIATEKAGIIKPGATAVIAQQQVGRRRRDPAGAGRPRRRDRRPRGVRVRRARPRAGRRRPAARAAGAARHLRGRVPAAVRRAPGVQRRVRAGGRRGVRGRCRDGHAGHEDGSTRSPSPPACRPRASTRTWSAPGSPRPAPRTARHPAALPDGHRGRRPQPGGHGGDRAGADGELRLRPDHRRRRGRGGQGRRGPARRARARPVRDRGDHELLAARRCPPTSWPSWPSTSSAKTACGSRSGSTTRSSWRWPSPTRRTRSADEAGGGGRLGAAAVLVTGSVVTAGDAQLLLAPASAVGTQRQRGLRPAPHGRPSRQGDL